MSTGQVSGIGATETLVENLSALQEHARNVCQSAVVKKDCLLGAEPMPDDDEKTLVPEAMFDRMNAMIRDVTNSLEVIEKIIGRL